MNEILENLDKWLEELKDENPMFVINKMLREGTAEYREYLRKVANLANHFCNDLGFVPNETLAGIIQDKLYYEALSNNTSQVVSRLASGITSIPSSNDDDFI